MRINLHGEATPRPPHSLLLKWATMLAEEYCVEVRHAHCWMSTDTGRQFVAKFLQDKGWKIHTYTTPTINSDTVLSYGFVVDDDCEHLVAWKLSNT